MQMRCLNNGRGSVKIKRTMLASLSSAVTSNPTVCVKDDAFSVVIFFFRKKTSSIYYKGTDQELAKLAAQGSPPTVHMVRLS